MAGFADLVEWAQPFLGRNPESATEGATWRFELADLQDSEGDPVDLTGTTGVCRIVDEADGSEVIVLDYTGAADGSMTLDADESDTADLAAGQRIRRCRWSLRISDGTDVVQVWGQQDSPFHVLAG